MTPAHTPALSASNAMRDASMSGRVCEVVESAPQLRHVRDDVVDVLARARVGLFELRCPRAVDVALHGHAEHRAAAADVRREFALDARRERSQSGFDVARRRKVDDLERRLESARQKQIRDHRLSGDVERDLLAPPVRCVARLDDACIERRARVLVAFAQLVVRAIVDRSIRGDESFLLGEREIAQSVRRTRPGDSSFTQRNPSVGLE